MKQYGILLLAVVALGACQTQQRQRQPTDQTRTDPALQSMELVDIAVVSPEVTGSDAQVLSTAIRASARKVLIDRKRYAVPKDAYVDQSAAASSASNAGSIANAAGSDAGLLITLDEWETGDLLPKGRIYASGKARLFASDGTRVLWERSFGDWVRLAPRNVTASNRAEVTEDMLRDMVREILSSFPAKPRR